MKKNIRLYNMILPPYLLMVFVPWLAALCLIGNFIIDSIVLLIISLIVFKRVNGEFYKKNILKVWLFGFAGDFVGILFLFIGSNIGYFYINSHSNENGLFFPIMEGLNNVTNHAYAVNTYSYVFIAIAIFVAAIAIFLFDYFIAFRKTKLTKKQKFLSSLAFAVFTAPYTFLIPNNVFY